MRKFRNFLYGVGTLIVSLAAGMAIVEPRTVDDAWLVALAVVASSAATWLATELHRDQERQARRIVARRLVEQGASFYSAILRSQGMSDIAHLLDSRGDEMERLAKEIQRLNCLLASREEAPQ